MNIFTVSLLQVDSINVNYNNSRTHNLSSCDGNMLSILKVI